MEIKTTYIGFNENGVKGIWCGFKPDNIDVFEERDILHPEDGMILRHKETQKEFSFVLLKAYDSAENYEEIEERK